MKLFLLFAFCTQAIRIDDHADALSDLSALIKQIKQKPAQKKSQNNDKVTVPQIQKQSHTFGNTTHFDNDKVDKVGPILSQVTESAEVAVAGNGVVGLSNLGSDATGTVTVDIGEEAFNDVFHNSDGIIYRYCPSCIPTHQHIYYKRLTLKDTFNPYTYMSCYWAQYPDNTMGTDFKLYSTLDDATSDTNSWSFCNYMEGHKMDALAGFRDCGPTGAVGGEWSTMVGAQGREGTCNAGYAVNKRASYTIIEKKTGANNKLVLTPGSGSAMHGWSGGNQEGATGGSDGVWGADNAFDGVIGTGWDGCCGGYPNQWIAYDFGEEEQILDAYSFMTMQGECPVDWTLNGNKRSDAVDSDGDWVTIDTQTNQNCHDKQLMKYDIPQYSDGYRKYMWRFTRGVGGNSNGIRLLEIELFGEVYLDAHQTIKDMLGEIKDSITEAESTATQDALGECTNVVDENLNLENVVDFTDVTKVEGDATQYTNLIGCGSASDCETKTEIEQTKAINAHDEIIRLEGQLDAWEADKATGQNNLKSDKDKKEALEQKKITHQGLHEKRMDKFTDAITILKRIDDALEDSGKIVAPASSLVSQEEKKVIQEVSTVGHAILMMVDQATTAAAAAGGDNESDLVQTLKNLLQTCIGKLEGSKSREILAHDKWIEGIDAEIETLETEIGRIGGVITDLTAKIAENKRLTGEETTKKADAITESNTLRGVCVTRHNLFTANMIDFASELDAIETMFEILEEAGLDAKTIEIRDEDESTKHGVMESIGGSV